MPRTEADRILKSSRHAIHLTDDLLEPQTPLNRYVLLRTHGRQCERMRRFIGEANASRERLENAVEALRQLMPVDAFRALLKAEGFATTPRTLAERISRNQSSTLIGCDKPGHTIAASQHLIVGVCYEVIDLLEDCSVNPKIFGLLRKVVPSRQVEIAQFMIALDRVKVNWARVLIALTPQSQLADPSIPRTQCAGITANQIEAMESESTDLSKEFRNTAERLGSWDLEFIAVRGYLNRLMDNLKIVRYLAHHFPKQLAQFQGVLETAPRS
ncbi:plasmid partitioning protein RepB C-terminal domain-containing protein [Mesorhizobium kowhaii]|uniref:RepB plasmid partition domain-containing protein n=1 Tax=Mesorhizobium kowhaii TaxID=1300272 RepID=A0A2W7CC31_9HYPH|nr:plasmid partitioning protein RepB C-terminal domain-containing protein [Mesorhizobium kowhaii]PZV40534.1 hypothetical protein B5V02_00460 [Mesorhizobium kowhaii]